jgi:CPA1 family monovalent cation:H+ antiporter
MIIHVIELLFLIVLALFLQASIKVPLPITLMSAIIGALFFHIKLFDIDNVSFDTIVIITLPLLITSDALKLKISEIKKHGFSLFWVAGINVLFSVLLGVLLNHWILKNYVLSVYDVIILFSIISATDPITVTSIFSNFKVPHKLKIITEGESLFNDATAIIVLNLALQALHHRDQITSIFIFKTIFIVVSVALITGIIIGYITTQVLKISNDALIETSIVLLGAYSSYWIADHLHGSGILSVIISILIINHYIQKVLKKDNTEIFNANKKKNLYLLRFAITNKENHQTILKNIEFIGLFASSILFISIATISNIQSLWHYKYVILSVFIGSTIIRAISMLKFAIISNIINNIKTSFMQKIQPHWLAILTLAGSKGALAILMVHLLPNNFLYKTLFENIVIGNVILSSFVYAIGLMFVFRNKKWNEKFSKEITQETIH